MSKTGWMQTKESWMQPELPLKLWHQFGNMNTGEPKQSHPKMWSNKAVNLILLTFFAKSSSNKTVLVYSII